jgi:hypothetical protein
MKRNAWQIKGSALQQEKKKDIPLDCNFKLKTESLSQDIKTYADQKNIHSNRQNKICAPAVPHTHKQRPREKKKEKELP